MGYLRRFIGQETCNVKRIWNNCLKMFVFSSFVVVARKWTTRWKFV